MAVKRHHRLIDHPALVRGSQIMAAAQISKDITLSHLIIIII
jgi:hypothetical protein